APRARWLGLWCPGSCLCWAGGGRCTCILGVKGQAAEARQRVWGKVGHMALAAVGCCPYAAAMPHGALLQPAGPGLFHSWLGWKGPEQIIKSDPWHGRKSTGVK
uniref:Uncharacterized protein n=1 Tax=Crocodylus porosus TaxID=8502 RepID=A0A7M4E261_CROPO